MKPWNILFAAIAAIAVATSSHAQPCACCAGGNVNAGNYDTATETTVTGTVDQVKSMPPAGRGMGGLHLVLSTASGPIDVHVGPAWFVSSKNVTFAKGDVLIVAGSSGAARGADMVIAREIRKGDQVLTLRDARGIPLWAGRNRGR